MAKDNSNKKSDSKNRDNKKSGNAARAEQDNEK